jgi:hypothetical protein
VCEEALVTMQFNEDKKCLWELARPTFKWHKNDIRAMGKNPMHVSQSEFLRRKKNCG